MSTLVRRFARNTVGRDLIVGDIHGTFTKLQQALDALRFNPATDRLFSVGDLVDRGPESLLALEWLERPWFFPVIGNHEDMAIRWPNGNMDAGNYRANGGGWNMARPLSEQRATSEAFAALPIAMELQTALGKVGIVHAECPFPVWDDFTWALEKEDTPRGMALAIRDAAMWSRERITDLDESTVKGVRAVVVGHTPMENMTSLGNTVFIDTMGWRGRDFTILDAADLRPAFPRLAA